MAPCGGCAARRARLAAERGDIKYQWMSEDGMDTKVYEKEIEAKAKVMYVGGSYRPINGG
jgi:hypothetical protein